MLVQFICDYQDNEVSPFVTQFVCLQLKWNDPDEEGLVKFLCGDKQFNEDRVRNGAKKLLKARHTGTQGRIDSFFKVLPSTNVTPAKRKVCNILLINNLGCCLLT